MCLRLIDSCLETMKTITQISHLRMLAAFLAFSPGYLELTDACLSGSTYLPVIFTVRVI